MLQSIPFITVGRVSSESEWDKVVLFVSKNNYALKRLLFKPCLWINNGNNAKAISLQAVRQDDNMVYLWSFGLDEALSVPGEFQAVIRSLCGVS